ncbi:unnamed protein product [Chrysodeixis includens]|uniref:Aldehyde oxidase n=1 Tax=Chrysodeixis includens TaxID=689277 RepID=A0A9N8PZL1_CHRIL|nr:unnamed protein product [Chrysodeixis includens]
MIVEANPPQESVEYRRFVAKSLFYKGLLTLCPPQVVAKRYQSGTVKIHECRPVSEGKQTFTTDPTMWPLNQPIVKVEAAIQCSGEAQYTDDIPSIHNEVFGAFVLSTVAKGTISKIDPSAALNLPGVLAFYTAKDIPGLNSFTPADSLLYTSNEEVLCDGNVKYYHQPIGIVVAETQLVADRAARYVRVQYTNVTKPVTDIKEAKKDSKRNTMFVAIDATNPGTDTFKTIKGSNTFYGQYHFTMETLVCVAKPTEEGIEVHSTTQWLDGVHIMISRALNLPENKIDVYVRRLGGAYGIKISRNIQCAVACSLVVQKMNRPCRFIQPLTTNMGAVGKRLPCSSDFEVIVDQSGKIQKIDLSLYEDNGYKINETLSALGVDVYYNCYDATKFNYKLFDTITETAKNSWCRSPGTLEAIASIEYVMEQISYELSLDPVAVRLANLDTAKYNDMVEMVELMKTNAEFNKRRSAVDSFNTQNRWKKRGLRWAFSRWSPAGAQRFDVNLSVFHADGSVVITHAGVEMGQGVNTKAVQLAAYLLKIPLEKIQIKGNNTIIAPNSFISGGSLTTQSIIIALRRCCDQLNARLEPIRTTLTNPTWEELITAAYNANVDLQAHGFVHAGDAQMYNVYGMALCEVEIDVLTGESEVRRVDILQDVGFSVSPEIDVGQVEGAFIMGLGYWTCERLVYSETGAVLTDRTWDYHVPQARDIPQDFRVSFKKNSYSNEVILGSKGTGEPATCASVVVAFALREAIVHARQDSGIPTTQWFPIDGPCTTEKCVIPITACHGLEITTIEEVGNRRKGYHPLQTTLANYNGSQCGYCSPGWIMTMYRCTGYRTILDAFKTFATDAPKTAQIPDIEDLKLCKTKSCNKSCDEDGWCVVTMNGLSIDDDVLKINLKDGKSWYRVNRVVDIFKVINETNAPYKLVCGNTAKVSSNTNIQIVTMKQFLTMDMKKKVIINVMIPPLNNTYRIKTFKVMPRSQNAHAVVNSGFLYKLTPENVVVHARIVFGGLSPSFIRASATERFLIGKHLFKNETLQAAINILKAELVVTENPPEESAAYRMKLALGLFYKGLLTLCPEAIIHPRFKSGRINILESRPVSRGQQMYETDPSTWPLNQPIPKMEGLIQCAGEAVYTDDIPAFSNEVYAAFVLATVGRGQISSIDANETLAGVNKCGIIQYNNYDVYEDNGYARNENIPEFGINVYNNCYNASTWNYKCIDTVTDTAKNTWARSPGTLEQIAMTELMMEQISYELSLDPVQVRLKNLDPKYSDLKEMYQTLKTNSDYEARRMVVNKFNVDNRWKKRGLRFVFLRWEHIYARYFDVNLAVYHGDGTVVISHGGAEIGQGINTKAAQIAAYMLGVPIEKVIIKENNTIVSPNAAVSGGSLTTQNIIIGVEKCCEQLLVRLEPIRRQLQNPTWEELIKKSFEKFVDLQAHGFVGKDDIQNYIVYGVTLAEVEIDVLTGESEILRVDILQDVGRSVNPALDIGQVEGAFVMGLGYWTSEKLVYDSNTGELLTDRTWNYFVPQVRDIPQDFRIYLRKKSYSTKPIFGSKACSEPPICMTVSIAIAMREAIVSARLEVGLPSTQWFSIGK